MSVAEFHAMLASEVEPYKRNRAFGALLATASGLGESGLTVVGGSALEIYTAGDYVSRDIDLVAAQPKKVETVLKKWGFHKTGMYWEHPHFGSSVQIVGRYDSGSPSRSQIVATPFGKVRLASMEDIVWKRVYEARGWNRPEALDEAALLVRRYSDRLDWEYIQAKGRENGVGDLVEELRRNRGVLSTGPAGKQSVPSRPKRNSK